MTTFLFWNLQQKQLASLLRVLVDDHLPDVLLLAECKIPVDRLLLAINQHNTLLYHVSAEPRNAPINGRVVVLSRLPRTAVRALAGNTEVALRRIFPPLGQELLLLGMHLSSKLYLDTIEQMALATRLRILIDDAEKKVRHPRTIVIGDLNMDPFEVGMTSSEAFHAVMDKRVAAKGSRQVSGQKRRFFYNPMWSRLGDASAGPSGTYYQRASGPNHNFWYTFDQVLLRPELLPNFRNENLEVLTKAGTASLLTTAGIPDRKLASDHLPLLFKI